jgi:hypothetical protein
MIPIPYGTRYFVTLSDRALRNVRCESCQGEFVYTVTCEATGSVLSFFELLSERTCRQRATEQARRKVAAGLAAPQAVACPACGWYQDSMVRLLKRRRMKIGLQIVGAIAVLSVIVAIATGLDAAAVGTLTLVLASIGIGVVLARHAIWDPNSLPSERARKARADASCAMTIAKYRATISEHAAQRAARDVQIAAAGPAAVLAGAIEPDTAAGRRLARADERRRRRQRMLAVAAIIAIGVAASLGIMLDAAVYGVPRGDSISDRATATLTIGPLLGLLCFFAFASGESDKPAGRASAARRPPLPIAPLAGLAVTSLLTAFIAVETGQRTAHSYLIVLGCEAGVLALYWLFFWLLGRVKPA